MSKYSKFSECNNATKSLGNSHRFYILADRKGPWFLFSEGVAPTDISYGLDTRFPQLEVGFSQLHELVRYVIIPAINPVISSEYPTFPYISQPTRPTWPAPVHPPCA